MLSIFLIFVLIGTVSAANNETASISSNNNLDIDNVKVNNIDKLSESSSSSDSFSGENDKVMVDSSVKNQSNSRILKNTDNNVLSSGEDDILSANGEITTCTVTSYSVGKVTLNLGGWYYTGIDTYGVKATATLSCNGYSSSTSLSATDATQSNQFMHFSGSATLDGAFYGGTKNTVSISVLCEWWAWSSSAGGWAWISGTVTKTASFTPSKATATIGSASSSNYDYGSSTSNIVVFSGQFSGKVGSAPFTKSGGAVIYRDGSQVATVAVDADGKWSYSISTTSLSVGSYTFSVSYSGNDYYNSISRGNSKTVVVSKNTPTIGSASVTNYNYGDTSTKIVYSGQFSGKVNSVSMAATNGAIILRDGSQVATVNVDANGKWSYSISTTSLDAGSYVFTVKYAGNSYYNAISTAGNSKTLVVSKGNYVVSYSTGNINYEDDKVLKVTIKNVNGDVISGVGVTLTGNGISSALTATSDSSGIATFTVSGLNAGTYDNWKVTIDGITNKYNQLSNNAAPTFIVNKLSFNPSISDNGDIEANARKLISAIVKNNKGAYVEGINVILTGKGITNNITLTTSSDGYVGFSVGDLAITRYNDWKLKITDPNNNYNDYDVKIAAFDVTKATPEFLIDAPAIGYGNDAEIVVSLPNNANGTVVINVGVKYRYTLNITNGEFSVNVERPDSGSYNVTATYSGDDYYKSSSTNTMLYVERPNAFMFVNVTNIVYGQDAEIGFAIYGNSSMENVVNAKGNIIVYGLNNASGYKVNVKNGLASLDVKNLNPGTYNIVAIYSGDNDYAGVVQTASFNVAKLNTSIILTFDSDFLTDSDVMVTVNVNQSINDSIQLYVDGVRYKINITNNGRASFVISNLSATSHSINATFLGNDFFNANSNVSSVEINKRDVTYTIDLKSQNKTIVFNVTTDGDITDTLNINGSFASIDVVDGKGKYVLENVKSGLHTFNITYVGNWKYKSFNATRLINVDAFSNYSLNITSDDAIYNETISIYVHTPSDLNGKTVNLTINNHNYTATVIGGIATFNNIYLVDVTTGSFDVTAIYSGDDIYAPLTNTTTIQVIPTTRYDIIVKVPDFVFVGDDAIINITAPSIINRVNITINGVKKEIPVGSYKLEKITEGIYNVVVSYDGDKSFAQKITQTESFNAVKQNITLTVTANDAIYKNDTIIDIVLSNNVTGVLLIRIDGNEYSYINFNNQKTTQLIDNTFDVGKHKLDVEFLGNDYYNSVSNSTNFTISKSNEYNITLLENNTKILNNSDVKAIEDDTFVLTVILPTDATGNVFVKLLKDNIQISTWNLTLPNNIITYKLKDVGNYSVDVEYSGDKNYDSTNFNFNLNVTPRLIVSNITFVDDNYEVLSDCVLNITSNMENRTLNVYIDGVYYKNITIIDLKASINLKHLNSGNHTITLKYDGDNVFSSIYALHNITVNKINSKVVVNAKSIYAGNMVTVSVNASGNGSATFIIFNSTGIIGTYSLLINNNYGTMIVPYVFNTTGVFNINVTYNGDNIYLSNSNTTSFNVDAAIDYEFRIITTDALVGETGIVNVTLPKNAAENVILTLPNGTNLTVKAVNGAAVFNINGLPYGNYTLNVTYSGDKNYQKATKQANISIFKYQSSINLTCDIKDFNETGDFIGSTTRDGKVNLIITLPSDAQGNVAVYLNNHQIGSTHELVSGKVTVELKDYFENGVNVVNVTYLGDNKYYNSTVVKYIYVSSQSTNLKVNVENSSYIVGSDVDINITTNAKGNLTIYVNSHLIESIIIDGNTTYTLKNVTAGEKLIMVIFNPNENYTGVFNTTSFNVVKKNATMGINVVGSSASLPVTVIVTVDENVTGWINAYVNGTTPQHARGLITNNQATFIFYGIEVGKHNVTIVYEGDDNYNAGNNSKIFTIDKAAYYPINITVNDVYIGDNAYVFVELPSGATGLINITFDGKIYSGILNENATVNITIPANVLTKVGKHNILVFYNGSDSFNETTGVSSFNVFKVNNYVININVTDIKFNDVEIINITLPNDVNNTIIKVLINDIVYNATVIDGNAVLRLNNLTVGSKLVKVIFGGNYKYVPLNATDKFVVSPDDVQLNIDVVAGITNATINIIATPNINETVNVYVGGMNKTVTLINGKGNITFTNLVAGNYTAIVIFDATENYTATSNKTSFTLNKQDFNITITVENNVLYVGENNTIIINYAAVKSTDLNITVNGKNVPLVIAPNGDNNTASITLTNLAEGRYDILVKYTGDEYNLANASKTFNVYKYDVDASESIIIWKNANVTVTMPNNASGIVTVSVNGKSYNKTINNGVALVEIPGLTVGNHTLVISYGNDAYYGEFSVNKVISVLPINNYDIFIINPSNPQIGVDNNIEVIVPSNATGKIAVYLDGKLLENASIVDGNAIIPVSGNLLTYGNHTIRAVYYGDVNYTENENNALFTISKQDISLNVVVDNVTVIDKVIVSITTNMGGADGGLVIDIGGTNYTVNIKNNTASITLNALQYGNYNVTAYYAGNDKYNAANATTRFNVAKLNTTIIATAAENIINVTLDSRATGIVYVEFKGKNYTGVIYKGKATIALPVIDGKFDLSVMYDGDEKFNQNNTLVAVTIHNNSNYTINVSIANPEIGVANNITVTLPVNATGNVSVYLDGVLIKNGILSGGKLIVPLSANLMAAGNHIITAIYSGDINYLASQNVTEFTLNKKSSAVNVSVRDIDVGDVEVIVVTISNNITGVVLLNINGNKYYVDVVNGTGDISIDKLTDGVYVVAANYAGNDIYNASNFTTKFEVTKVSNYTIDANYSKIINNATKVTVTLPDDATGLVTIIIADTNFTGVIYKGKAIIDVNNIVLSQYNYTIIWDGDEKYVNGSASGVIYNEAYREKSQIIVNVEDILAGDAALININVTDGATGNVRITVNGKNIIVPLVNSSVTYKLVGLTNGTYDVNVTYLGDNIYAVSENSTTFKVSKINSTIKINVSEGKVGEQISITITGPNDASGIVNIIINGTSYNAVMVNGEAVFVTTFDKYGQYNITANYVGNDKYNPNSNSSLFVVNSVSPSVIIKVEDIKVGQDATITIEVPSDATGIVIIGVDSVRYNTTINSGKAIFTIPNLSNGTYGIVAVYNGDDKYEINANRTSFNVTKINIVPDVRANPIVESKTNITVNVFDDVTGNITLFVGNKTISSPIIGGVARFNLDNVVNGTNVTFVYDGDSKYNKFNASAILFDSGIKISSALSIMISNIRVGDDAVITVGVTEKANGTITINIAGKNITKVIQDGKVTFTVSDLAYGTYNVTAIYSGDDKFLSSNITSSIFVAKYDSIVVVTVGDIKVGENATITVKVLDDATGNVSLKINDINYDPVIISDGKAVFTISGLGNGTYTAVATYNGNAKYLNSTGNATFDVSKVDINVNVESTSVLENKTNVTVLVPNDATGNITILVGGSSFTGPIVDGKALINISGVGDGTNITIIYDGDDKYNGFSEIATVTDNGLRINSHITVVTDKDEYLVGETAVITITVPDDARGNVTIKISGEIVNTSDISDGKVIYNYVVPTSGLFNIEVIYNGDTKYAKIENTTSFEASKVNSTVIISVDTVQVGDNATIIVTVPDDATGNITIIVGSYSESKVIVNGTAKFSISSLTKGEYTVNAIYNPLLDPKYNGNSNSTSFEVVAREASMIVDVEAGSYGDKVNITVTLPSDATGYVTITVGDNSYVANVDSTGVARLSLSDLKPGVTNVDIEYSGDTIYVGALNSTTVVVDRKASYVDVSAGNISKGEVAVITVTVPVDATGIITIIVNGVEYNTTIKNGVAVFDIADLAPGDYNVYARYSGSEYYKDSVNDTVSFSVLTDQSIVTEVVTRGYGSAYDYEALFTDKAGNPLANTNVTFAVNGKEYIVTTDENGIARLPGGTLGIGNHTIIAVNPVTDDKNYNTTEILPRLIGNKDIEMDFADGSVYSVLVLGDDGKPVGAGVEVTMEVHSVAYKVKTDANGFARLAINLNPGTYNVGVEYAGFKVSNTIVVKQTLTAKKTQKVKKSKKKNKIKAKVMFSNGKPVTGVKVTMKLKSKTFTAKTNAKGIAKFKLSKKVVKKLKVGKKYKVTFTYLTNSINKKIKVKR